ncbi:helix-turn-helix transcriptional regulator [Aureimonas ureilytica]|uniref:helix-turn-helix transcriptional regulator n=1 Tax=Aureimonas ureilytica TaxID=401562 RepID=UPI003CE6ED3D
MSVQAVAERLGVSIKTLWRMRTAGDFPALLTISRRSKRWRPEIVETYIEELEEKG